MSRSGYLISPLCLAIMKAERHVYSYMSVTHSILRQYYAEGTPISVRTDNAEFYQTYSMLTDAQ